MKLLVLFTKDDAESSWAWDSIYLKFEDWMKPSFPQGEFKDGVQMTKWELVETNDDVSDLLCGNTSNPSIHGNYYNQNGTLEFTDEDNEKVWEWLETHTHTS